MNEVSETSLVPTELGPRRAGIGTAPHEVSEKRRLVLCKLADALKTTDTEREYVESTIGVLSAAKQAGLLEDVVAVTDTSEIEHLRTLVAIYRSAIGVDANATANDVFKRICELSAARWHGDINERVSEFRTKMTKAVAAINAAAERLVR